MQLAVKGISQGCSLCGTVEAQRSGCPLQPCVLDEADLFESWMLTSASQQISSRWRAPFYPRNMELNVLKTLWLFCLDI